MLLCPKDINHDGCLGVTRCLPSIIEGNLVIDLAFYDPERLEVILPLADRHELKGSPSTV
jgi:hypothetical protein